MPDPFICTLTGVDEHTPIHKIARLQRQYPFVEFGVLVSPKHAGTGRYPSYQWIDTLLSDGAISRRQMALHVCGEAVERLLSGELRFSRALQFPSFVLGPRSVSSSLARLWANADSVLLTSATMLTVDAGALTPRDFGYLNALPVDRTVMLKPVSPTWLYTTPELYWPKGRGHTALCPPRAKDGGDFASALVAWAARQALEIDRIAASAIGGTLVLCTGFDRAALITASVSIGLNRVVLQSPTLSSSDAEKLFRALHAEGKRPVWFSTGGAWTGLNLTMPGCDACDDFLLTDLVIPALPFGTNLTTSHAFRCSRKAGFLNELAHALLMFRQGIGRLVRREGLLKRRIHITDGRLHSQLHLAKGFRQIIGTYPRHRQV